MKLLSNWTLIKPACHVNLIWANIGELTKKKEWKYGQGNYLSSGAKVEYISMHFKEKQKKKKKQKCKTNDAFLIQN